ncbi:MAG: ABC transporter ATP-binding protein, partial [Spirochaetales bacterium]|nr:ABC transporter ATP-binding protein [Spirochaetales bacterium]
FRSPVMLIFAIIMVIRNGSELAAVFAIAIPVIICGIILTFSLTKKYFERAFKGFDKFNRVVQENLNGIRTVKAYVREEVEEDKFRESAEDIKYNFSKGQKIMAATHPVIMLISYTCMIAISYLGAKIINVGNMETGELMSIYTYTGQILSSLIMTGMIIIMFSISWPSMKRIAEVLESEISMDLNEDGIKSVPDGSVSFKNVDFAYKEGKNVLKNINLDIKSGETVGILGTTGSGKTTLISLIARLYDVTSGSLCVGGIDVKDYNVHALRDAVSVVLQKNTLFSGTIAENLRWGDMNGSLEKMEEVAKHASAFGFISEKENGFDSRVEQGGSNFSGGQKQRLTIARALMKEPKILILDDSTSAVDTATDRSIREALNKSVKGMTKIIISQRISSIEDADKIVIMNKGEIEAVGTHDELIKTNEAYRDLYETQTRGANG